MTCTLVVNVIVIIFGVVENVSIIKILLYVILSRSLFIKWIALQGDNLSAFPRRKSRRVLLKIWVILQLVWRQ